MTGGLTEALAKIVVAARRLYDDRHAIRHPFRKLFDEVTKAWPNACAE